MRAGPCLLMARRLARTQAVARILIDNLLPHAHRNQWANARVDRLKPVAKFVDIILESNRLSVATQDREDRSLRFVDSDRFHVAGLRAMSFGRTAHHSCSPKATMRTNTAARLGREHQPRRRRRPGRHRRRRVQLRDDVPWPFSNDIAFRLEAPGTATPPGRIWRLKLSLYRMCMNGVLPTRAPPGGTGPRPR